MWPAVEEIKLTLWKQGNYTTKGKKNITYCSNGKPDHRHNKTTEHDSSPLSFIKNLHLPDPVGLGMEAITLISKIIAAFYILGIMATFTALMTSAASLALSFRPLTSHGKTLLLAMASMAFSALAFFCLLLASAITQFIVNRICNFFNHHPKLGVAATKGANFDRCSWVTVALMGIAVIACVAEVTLGVMGRFRKERPREGQNKAYEMEEE